MPRLCPVRQPVRCRPTCCASVYSSPRAWRAGGCPCLFFALLLVACLGAAQFQVALPDADDREFIAAYNHPDAIYWVEGILVQPPDVRDTYTNLRLEVERLGAAGEPAPLAVHGKLLASYLGRRGVAVR